MKKLTTLVVSFFALCYHVNAQQRTGLSTNSPQSEKKNEVELIQSIKNCNELQNELTNSFGNEYSLKDQKVITKLEQVSKGNPSNCSTKISTYVLKSLSEVNSSKPIH